MCQGFFMKYWATQLPGEPTNRAKASFCSCLLALVFKGLLILHVEILLIMDKLHNQNTAMLRDVMGKTFRLLGYTIQYGCIAHCAFEYLGGIVVCSGPSMEPTIQNSDIVISENLSCHFYSIQKGDIVIAKNPSDPKSNICKRVIGLEGDKICTSGPSNFKIHSYVPKGHVWLEGDNLRNSTDSRCYGPVPYGLIKGRICFKLWPLTNFGLLRASPNSNRISKD
ncbi:mitochondrial inner membrane protease subunit 1 isoform X2 [Paroedura picta]|uniref:mitochondrial inner membrane protease subunit 1 isoform X2 n=1 Tax=Paroedura picta TaxID=143630 RepID=UPI0040561A40